MTTNKPEVKRYDCTSGGAQYCYGCYTMEEDELGDYVEWEAYEALQAERDALVEALERARDRLESERRSGEFDPLIRDINDALAAHRKQGGEAWRVL